MSSMKSSGVKYWRSLQELATTPEFREAVAREFPNDEWDRLPPATRRQFLKVMGASLAFAGLTSCRWPEEEIVPFAHRPEGRTPGVPQQFATALEMGGSAVGVLATSYDGRPIKLEGNPLHPDSRGGLSAQLQAAILELYDPDRSRRLVYREAGQEYVKSWDDLQTRLREQVTAPGDGLAILSEATSSPTVVALRIRLAGALPRASWFEYEPISRDAEREGLRLVYGQPMRAVHDLSIPRVIACFDADPLFDHPAAVGQTRAFTEGRAPTTDMSRLYAVEATYSTTGGRADHRLAVAASRVPSVLAQVAHQLFARHHLAIPAGAGDLVSRLTDGPGGVDAEFVGHLADDLAAHQGRSLVVVGPRQETEVHALAALLNDALGNVGGPLTYVADGDPDRPSHMAAIRDLSDRMRNGDVRTLLILGGNPVYDAPADVDFAGALKAVDETLHLSLYDDETSRRCSWHLPRAHALESWGDGRAWDGTWTCQQPLIEPLYGGRTPIEVLAMLLGEVPVKGYDLVRATMRETDPAGGDDARWRQALHDGLLAGSRASALTPQVSEARLGEVAEGLGTLLTRLAPSIEALELNLVIDPKVGDGRWANNAWLQELPDVMTKIAWDNAVLTSPATMREVGVEDGDVLRITANEATFEAPVYTLPGHARNSLTLALGYGRTAAGQVGNGVGIDAYPARTTAAPSLVTGVKVEPTGRRYTLAATQDHHAIDTIGFEARNLRIATLVREASLDEYLAHPEVIQHMSHHPPLISLWREKTYQGEQWGMAIDLNACTGCNACVVACQAENNIPVVGREQVINQREMHWIRVDRYFKTADGVPPDQVEDAAVVMQPMTCVQCENAPCEQVCPVAATQHTEDGLNAMVYNRCVGTRYCSNNCPFKVRRFNFFNYHKNLADISQMQYNPEVTVRSRGVMEKCTFCVQRIHNARIVARNDSRPLADGEVTPACAQTCPAQAIHFGNLNDPSSSIAALHEDARSYATLAELNIKPRTVYMARLRNPANGREAHPEHGSDGHDASHGKESA
jgi:MoCo/4Fe-4S cofactor protein with predicted Tat translocation signal